MHLQGVGSFDGRPVSLWMGGDSESRAVFVAENECIGCQMVSRCHFESARWGG